MINLLEGLYGLTAVIMIIAVALGLRGRRRVASLLAVAAIASAALSILLYYGLG